MEDVTDTVFRRIVRAAGAPDLFFTEFTSTDGLCTAGRPRVIGRLRYTLAERPLVAQVWGNRPEHYRRGLPRSARWASTGWTSTWAARCGRW
jgi:tRNA-dihydrouridine synthase